MRIQTEPPLHLTYCLNVHPGERWAENLSAIRTYALAVRDRVGADGAFGLGLRLGAQAAEELADPAALSELRALLADEGLYVFTINGFPYGPFHGEAVKERVYAPDWRQPERLAYTRRLAEILAALLPEGVTGSISTAPGSYRRWIAFPADTRTIADQVAALAGELAELHDRTGRDICLGLEPEPDCLLETTDEAIAFCTGPLLEAAARRGGGKSYSPDSVLRHIGVCFDLAHQFVEFEDLAGSLGRLQAAGVRVAKIHASAALRAQPTQAARQRLGAFCDPVYLHQVKARWPDGTIRAWPDLADALADASAAEADEWRVHFHVPLFWPGDAELDSSAAELPALAGPLRAGATEHLEIETYTFAVLPPELRSARLDESIAREYEWVLGTMLAGQ